MPDDETTPKLHVDSDWKAEAQAEKERLAAAEKARDAEKPAPGPDGRELPQGDFKSLVGVLASQALMGLGTMQDPETKGVVIDLEGARFSIDLLSMLEEKTKGNLDAEEASELSQLLAELRARFVQVTQLIAQHAAAGGDVGVMSPPGTPPVPGAETG